MRIISSWTNFLLAFKKMHHVYTCIQKSLYFIIFQFQETSIIFKSKWVQFINEKITASFCLFGSYTGECVCSVYMLIALKIFFKLHIIPNLVNLFNWWNNICPSSTTNPHRNLKRYCLKSGYALSFYFSLLLYILVDEYFTDSLYWLLCIWFSIQKLSSFMKKSLKMNL